MTEVTVTHCWGYADCHDGVELGALQLGQSKDREISVTTHVGTVDAKPTGWMVLKPGK